MCKPKSDRHLRTVKKQVQMRSLSRRLSLVRRQNRLRPSLSKTMTQRRMSKKIMGKKMRENQRQIQR
jgi:hypothetical protein